MRLNETLGDFVHLPAMRAKHWDGEFPGWNYLGPTPKGCCKSSLRKHSILELAYVTQIFEFCVSDQIHDVKQIA